MAHEEEHIQRLLEDRYYLRDEEGNLLEYDPDEMFTRVAVAIAKAEKKDFDKWQTAFSKLMRENKFLPNTPTLINAGKEKGVYAACNVLEIPDSMEGIFDTLKMGGIISKYGGGLGLYFGDLRESGSVVKSTGQTASGPVSFMQLFDAMCNTVKQGGNRRGAMLASIPVWHPDIEEFIKCKDDGESFSNFNISVVITDDFMEAVQNDLEISLRSPVTNLPIKSIRARVLWDKIVEHAWKTGDPGLIFIDEANRTHPLGPDYPIKTYNACGEQPLRHGESCVLGSINLMAYLTHVVEDGLRADSVVLKNPVFDWDKLAEDIPTMVRFLDDVIDASPYPVPEVEKATKESRKIGLGIMGWADLLIKMKIPYDSQEALDLAENVMGFIKRKAEKASALLGKEKGDYPLRPYGEGTRRNATLLCVAPTGTISRIAGVSSGIEPVFAWETHHNLEGHEYDEEHWAYTEERIESNYGRHGKWPSYMKTANQIPWEWHLKMQAAFQKYIDASVSKTINLPADATVDDVNDIYLEAWKLGLKGITIYRDGSKDNQPLNKIDVLTPEEFKAGVEYLANETAAVTVFNTVMLSEQPKEAIETAIKDTFNGYRKRGPVTIGVTHKVDTTKGKAYITVNYSEYHTEPVEVFIRLGHMATPQEQSYADYIGRLISVMLKYSIPIDRIQKQGNKVYSDTVFWYNKNSFQSIPMLLSYLIGFTFEKAIEMSELDIDSMLDNGNDDPFCSTERLQDGGYCYNCGIYGVINEGGCRVCTNCGDEKCG